MLQTKKNVQELTAYELLNGLRQYFLKSHGMAYTQPVYTLAELQAEKARRDEITGKPLTGQEQINFIAANAEVLKDHDTKELYQMAFERVLTKALPYTSFHYGKNYMIDKFHVNFNHTIEHNKNRFETFLKMLGIDIYLFGLYNNHNHLFDSDYFRRSDKPNTFVNAKLDNLVNFLITLTTGQQTEDLKQCHEFMAANNLEHKQAKYKFTISGLTVEGFVNGNIKITGLTEENNKLIDGLLNIKHLIYKNWQESK